MRSKSSFRTRLLFEALEERTVLASSIVVTPSTIAENQSANTVIGTISVFSNPIDPYLSGITSFNILTSTTDPNYLPNDNTHFEVINGNQLRTKISFNYETKSSYRVVLNGSNSSFAITSLLTVTVNNVNDAPVIQTTSASVAENSLAVTTIAATDEDLNTLLYSIPAGVAGGVDGSKFSINPSTGAISFITAPDFENPTDVGTNNVYNLNVQVNDGNGGITSGSVAVTVTNVTGEFAQVSSVTIDDGTSQRSVLKKLTIDFNKVVDVSSGAFTVIRRDGSGGSTGTVSLNVSQSTVSGKTRILLTFSGPSTLVSNGSLVDGNYQLTIDATKIKSGGEQLDGDKNGVAGGNLTFGAVLADTFYRLLGDANGDRTSGSSTDNTAILAAMTSPSNYNAAFDFDGDGDVDARDHLVYKRQGSKTLTFA